MNRLLKCINKGSYHLTVGKTYKAEPYDKSIIFDYLIINDIGHKHGVEKELFIIDLKEERIRDLN